MKFFRSFDLLVVVVLFRFVFAGKSATVLQKLMDGNKRYVVGTSVNKDLGEHEETGIVKGSASFAIVITCSDSRVPPEHIFDQGLGDIFVIRVAGMLLILLRLAALNTERSMYILLSWRSHGTLRLRSRKSYHGKQKAPPKEISAP